MKENSAIRDYYNQLATEYDDDRFNNTYGSYLHAQERAILKSKLKGISKTSILDMGCGTGRFLEFAQNGVDFSEGMLQEAKAKFPNHQLKVSDIRNMPFSENSFDAIFSLHVFMHLDLETVQQTIQEAHRILKPNGILIFDFPSKTRRELINYQKDGWHGNTALDFEMVNNYSQGLFEVEGYQGVLFFPIHRIPENLRVHFRKIDTSLGQSFLKKWSSYHFVFLRKI